MEFFSLTPYQLAERLKPRSAAKPPKRKRSNGLACYVPLGDAQASRRVTGAHLDPDSDEMMQAAVVFASGLVCATENRSDEIRSIIGPARYSDRVLANYCNMLIKGALGKPQDFTTTGPVSPSLAPYLLGGITTKTVEELCYRALEVMDFFPEPMGQPSLQRALSNVGFGLGIRHEKIGVDPDKKYNHLSMRQDYLLNLRRGVGYARLLTLEGAYGESLHRLLDGYRAQVIAETEALFDPAGGEMTALAAKDRHAISLTDVNYWRAVRKVFEREWQELDLDGDPEKAVADAEAVMARKIIQRISYNDRMNAESLVGISLLTGISIACWLEFAVYDQKRRGETFITADEIDRAIEMVEVSPHFKCEQELRGHATAIRYFSDAPRKWARRLQSPNKPLWSSKGTYYLERYTAEGIPQFKYKPVSLSSDK